MSDVERMKARIEELERQIAPLQEELAALRAELAPALSPYKVGDVVERVDGYSKKRTRWKVTAIKPSISQEGYTGSLRNVRADGSIGVRSKTLRPWHNYVKVEPRTSE